MRERERDSLARDPFIRRKPARDAVDELAAKAEAVDGTEQRRAAFGILDRERRRLDALGHPLRFGASKAEAVEPDRALGRDVGLRSAGAKELPFDRNDRLAIATRRSVARWPILDGDGSGRKVDER